MKIKLGTILAINAALCLVWILVASSSKNEPSAVGNWGLDPEGNKNLLALYPGEVDTKFAVIELKSNGGGDFLGDIIWKENSETVQISSEVTPLRQTFAQNGIGSIELERWVLKLHKLGSDRLKLNTSDGKQFLVLRKLVP